MANWYMKGQSDYLAGDFHMALYIDYDGFDEGDYNTRNIEDHGATSDPFMAFGVDTEPTTWTYGQQRVEIGLLKSHRIKFDTTGCYKWIGPNQDDWALLETGGGGNLNDLDDVVITGTPADNELLSYDNGTSKWINQTPAEAGLATTGEAHILATSGPHTGTLPWGDLSKTGSNLTDLATRQHAGLTDVTSDQHHAKQHAMDDITQHTRGDNAVLDASTTYHGFLKKLDNVATNFMNGQGNWAVPTGTYGDADAVQAVEDAGLTLSAGQVITSEDADLTFDFGRNRLWSPTADKACFGHRDQALPAIDVTNDGTVRLMYVGTKTLTIYRGIGIQMTFGGTGATMSVPIAMGTNKITGLAEATANGDAVRWEQLHEEVHDINSHSDVTITGPAESDILQCASGVFVDRTLAEAGIAAAADLHAEAHVLGTSGPHTGTLPWGDLSKTGSSLADLVTRAHSNLSDAPTSAHHVRYADSEAVSAVATADDYVKLIGDTLSGDLIIQDGDATYGLTTGLTLDLGIQNSKAGAIKLRGVSAAGGGLIQSTTDNLHIDSLGGSIYLGYYDPENVYLNVDTTYFDVSGHLVTSGNVDGKDVSGLCTTAEAVSAVVAQNPLTLTYDLTVGGGNIVSANGLWTALTANPDGYIWAISGQYPTYGIYYNGGTPDYFEWHWNSAVKAKMNMETGLFYTYGLDAGGQAITNVGNVDGVDVSAFNAAMREQSATFPGSPVEGDRHYDEDDDSEYRYNADSNHPSWVEVGTGGALGNDVELALGYIINPTERSHNGGYALMKEITLNVNLSRVKISWEVKTDNSSFVGYTKVYVNDIAISDAYSCWSETYSKLTYILDNLESNDKVQIYGSDSIHNVFVKNFIIGDIGTINASY